uniref:Uncharacterized protein n=1 Tax=Heterorhabditis bacteriophora TaxID=37862 RepID=A0A1I7XJY7_HETBA
MALFLTKEGLRRKDVRNLAKLPQRSTTIFRLYNVRASATELLTNMRKRFQHRATEPIFHTLATTQETGFEQQSSSRGGSDNALKMPQMVTLLDERMTDSEPVMINQLHNKPYHKYLRKY